MVIYGPDPLPRQARRSDEHADHHSESSTHQSADSLAAPIERCQRTDADTETQHWREALNNANPASPSAATASAKR